MDQEHFQELQERLKSALIVTTRTTGQLAKEDLNFHRSLNPDLDIALERRKTRLLGLARNLVNVATTGTRVLPPELSNADSIDDGWNRIVDVFDSLLERADACIDEHTGLVKKPRFSQEENLIQSTNQAATRNSTANNLYRSLNLEKPQVHFDRAPVNHGTHPFVPLLIKKPNALKPLADSIFLTGTQDEGKQFAHPYQSEIEEASIPRSALIKRDPIPYLPFASTDATFVDTPDGVEQMLIELRRSDEIAIDLEHHDEHSYIGIVSLMQISTRQKDWIIDTLKPWREKLSVLNEVFTDPRILKVLHGSTMDIIWLQRDLGLYIVGLFDTYHASWALGYPKHSLAFLLKRFVDFDAAKQYQMADWRIRPLPEELFNYARSDTHFLLYIYDMMRNELLENSDMTQDGGNLVERVMQNSNQEALQRYERPVYDEQNGSGQFGWYQMLYRALPAFDKKQFAVFRAVHQWRDGIARDEDESLNAVMSRKSLFSIAREIPLTIHDLLHCCHPISRFFMARKLEVLELIRKTNSQDHQLPEMKDVFALKEPMDESVASFAARPGVSTAQRSVGRPLQDRRSVGISRDNGAALSSLWGPAIGAAETSRRAQLPDLDLVLPLPSLSLEDVDHQMQNADENDMEIIDQEDATAQAKHQSTNGEAKANEMIVLHRSEANKKRKLDGENALSTVSSSNAVQDKPDSGVDTMSLQKEYLLQQEQAQRRLEKREQRRERKRSKQNAIDQNGPTKTSQLENPAKPFDYANAPSVLHAKHTTEQKQRNVKSANPYAKALDAPHGIRRLQKENPGKSMTFKK